MAAYADHYMSNEYQKKLEDKLNLDDFDDKINSESYANGKQHKIIDCDADKVKASYESCHIGETVIPAIKEQTHVQQAASYASDTAAQYIMKGVANNNYKLKGQITQTDAKVYKGAEK